MEFCTGQHVMVCDYIGKTPLIYSLQLHELWGNKDHLPTRSGLMKVEIRDHT